MKDWFLKTLKETYGKYITADNIIEHISTHGGAVDDMTEQELFLFVECNVLVYVPAS